MDGYIDEEAKFEDYLHADRIKVKREKLYDLEPNHSQGDFMFIVLIF